MAARVESKLAGFSAEELSQLRRFAALSFAQKVQWLEEAHRLALLWNARRPEPENGERGNEASGAAKTAPETESR